MLCAITLLCGESRSLIEAQYREVHRAGCGGLLCGESRSLIEATARSASAGIVRWSCSAAKAAASLKRLVRSCSDLPARVALRRKPQPH